MSHLLEDQAITKVLVFTRTKHLAGRLAKQSTARGVAADVIRRVPKSKGPKVPVIRPIKRSTGRAKGNVTDMAVGIIVGAAFT